MSEAMSNEYLSELYAEGCDEGRIEAELYLHELRLRPGEIGLPLVSNYLEKISGVGWEPWHPGPRGKLVGFTARIEEELGTYIAPETEQK